MRLVSAHIIGYGRLVDAKVNLDSKVIAVVGPNESGKTTFLKALAYLDEDRALTTIERSRAGRIADSTRITAAQFSLSDEDCAALVSLDLEAQPHTMYVSRRADGGNPLVEVAPCPRKAVKHLKSALAVLRRATSLKRLEKLLRQGTVFTDPDAEGARDFRSELQGFVDAIQTIVEGTGNGVDQESLGTRARELSDALEADAKVEKVRGALSDAAKWLAREDPTEAVGEALWRRTPDFLLFVEADRTLQSNHSLDDVLLANVPPALSHLLRMAGLDLGSTVEAHRASDIARRDTALDKANNRLKQLFAVAWKQAKLSVKLTIDGDLLRVSIVEDGENITVFDERSAGLRMFVALVAFLATRDTKTPPVLLIDEAESHLHIDAQADLVNMFISQEQAARVIYTTHSPACLPPDLGVGIRSVIPSPNDSQVSEIRNSFWSNGAGYSPLMIAMGAAAAAFTPARRVVLGEGATEMLMLPSLMRSVTGLDILPYQVAPGLSEVPKDFYSSLDLEGAKVAYLLDGDSGGAEIRKNLLKSGVSEHRIVMLPVPGLENVLPAETYLQAVAGLLAESNPGTTIPTLPKLRPSAKSSWASQLRTWVEGNGLVMPSKVAVANRIVEAGDASPSVDFAGSLRKVHEGLLKALEVG